MLTFLADHNAQCKCKSTFSLLEHVMGDDEPLQFDHLHPLGATYTRVIIALGDWLNGKGVTTIEGARDVAALDLALPIGTVLRSPHEIDGMKDIYLQLRDTMDWGKGKRLFADSSQRLQGAERFRGRRRIPSRSS
jgi:hypothetical protein